MSSSGKVPTGSPVEIESTDRWVGGKSEAELLADLKVYLACLRDNPHSLVDRLRVAAIQLRLGRVQEALVHYEGVLRGYVADGQIMSAIALCQRILAIYPHLPRIQRILAALYARVPHGASTMPTPVSPIVDPLEERATATFVVGDGLASRDPAAQEVEGEVMESVFPDRRVSPTSPPRGRDLLQSSEDLRPTMPYPQQRSRPRPDQPALQPVATDEQTRAAGTEETVIPDAPVERRSPRERPILLTQPKDRSGLHPVRPEPSDDGGGPVMLLTRKKKH
jgi:hypothetical protein